MKSLLTAATSLVLFAGAAGAAPLTRPPNGGAPCRHSVGFHDTAYLPGLPAERLGCCQEQVGCAQFLSTRSLVHGGHGHRT